MADPTIDIWAEERDNPDLRRLARALIDIAIAESEKRQGLIGAEPVEREAA